MKGKIFILIVFFFYQFFITEKLISFAYNQKNEKGETGKEIVIHSLKNDAIIPVSSGFTIDSKRKKLPKTSKSKFEMIVHFREGRTVRKEFIVLMKKNFDSKGTDGMLSRFTKGSSIKGLGHVRKGKIIGQWIKFSWGKLKRIDATVMEMKMFGSNICFGDFRPRGDSIDDFNFKYLGDKKILGFDCYIVEAVEKDKVSKKKKLYNKFVVYLRKSDYFFIRNDFYKYGKLLKYLELHNIRVNQGYLIPLRIVMVNAEGSGKTEIIMKKGYPKLNIKIKNRTFIPWGL